LNVFPEGLKKILLGSLDEVSREHGDSAIVSNYHECRACGKGMPHCQSSIRSHVTKVHGLTLDAYYEQHKRDIDSIPVTLPITDPALLASRKFTTPKKIQDEQKKVIRDGEIGNCWYYIQNKPRKH
jgi:hypothetical protein